MKEERRRNVGFEIKVNKNGTIAKASMKKLASLLLDDCKDELNASVKHVEYFVTDTTATEYCVILYNGNWIYDYQITITIEESDKEIHTAFSFDFDDDENKIAFDNSDYETTIDRI